MWDYNIFDHGDLDEWTGDLDEARAIATAYYVSTGQIATITKYPLRETPDGWETDIRQSGEIVR